MADGESSGLVDITGDGRPEIFAQSSGPALVVRLGFAQVDWTDPFDKATYRPITPRTPENDTKYFRYTHGAGTGDINGDGRIDVVTAKRRWAHGPGGDPEPNAAPVLSLLVPARAGRPRRSDV